jgi:hypothetical protein
MLNWPFYNFTPSLAVAKFKDIHIGFNRRSRSSRFYVIPNIYPEKMNGEIRFDSNIHMERRVQRRRDIYCIFY